MYFRQNLEVHDVNRTISQHATLKIMPRSTCMVFTWTSYQFHK